MSKVSFYEEKAEEFAEPLAAEMGFELVDVEFVKEGREDYLRIYIDKPVALTLQTAKPSAEQ